MRSRERLAKVLVDYLIQFIVFSRRFLPQFLAIGSFNVDGECPFGPNGFVSNRAVASLGLIR